RAGLSRALPRGPGTRRGPHRYRLGAGRPRAFPGDRCRSPLEVGVGQRGGRAAVAWSGSGSVAATCQRAAPGVASHGLAPHTVNLAEWWGHLLARLRRQIELTADPELIKLLNELQRYPVGRNAKPPS